MTLVVVQTLHCIDLYLVHSTSNFNEGSQVMSVAFPSKQKSWQPVLTNIQVGIVIQFWFHFGVDEENILHKHRWWHY